MNGQHNIGKSVVFPDGGAWELSWSKRAPRVRAVPDLVIPPGWVASLVGPSPEGREDVRLDGVVAFPGEGTWIIRLRRTGGRGTR